MLIKEIRQGETEHDAFLRHRDYLNSLTTFYKKLEYWLDKISNCPNIAIAFKVNENDVIELILQPKSDDDQRKMNKATVDYHREVFFNSNDIESFDKTGKKFKYVGGGNEQRAGFRIEPFEEQVSEFNNRLSEELSKKSKNELLREELEYITTKINTGKYPIEIKELRSCFARRKIYNFDFKSDDYPDLKAVKVAEFWDIIKYEDFLKKMLLSFDELVILPSTTNSSFNQSRLDNIHKKRAELTNEEKLNIVASIIAPLGGINSQNKLIMKKGDFQRLINYINQLVLTERLPTKFEQIEKINISNDHIRYTIYRLHGKLYGTRLIKLNFIDFIHLVFKQFANTAPRTTKSKFSTPPKSYEKDFAGYIGEVL